jgi:hypothetical protein
MTTSRNSLQHERHNETLRFLIFPLHYEQIHLTPGLQDLLPV